MKIKGFTLAEVLIVLAVLGVIAALTLPAIMSNVQKQQVGPALMRAISTLDTANALITEEQQFYNFRESCIEANNNAGYINNCFEPFIMRKIGAGKLEDIDINYDSITNPNQNMLHIDSSAFSAYTTKTGYAYYFLNQNFTPDWPYITMYIDINGPSKRPNTYGKDLFWVLIDLRDDGGRVLAAGSKTTQYNPGHWDEPGNRCDSTAVENNGHTCAGSIVDNGGRVIYKW